MTTKPGHGDHWRAAIGEDEPRLREVLEFPVDAPEGIHLHRRPMTEAVDLVQVTARRRLLTAYPEPRATTLARVRPRELLLWETRVEAWLVAEHAGAGALTLFLTDLVERASDYERARGEIDLELSALAYSLERAPPAGRPDRLRPADRMDTRFLPDDHWFEGTILAMRGAGQAEVLDVALHGGLTLPIATRAPTGLAPGDRAQGFAWLTARWPERP